MYCIVVLENGEGGRHGTGVGTSERSSCLAAIVDKSARLLHVLSLVEDVCSRMLKLNEDVDI